MISAELILASSVFRYLLSELMVSHALIKDHGVSHLSCLGNEGGDDKTTWTAVAVGVVVVIVILFVLVYRKRELL